MRKSVENRELRVLEALIKLYVERRAPISSRMLEQHAGLGIRSASIRSVLGELEGRGYLSQPHSSSGRVPTEDGFRAYVDARVTPEPLGELERREIERALSAAGQDLSDIVQATAQVLGRLSSNIAIVAGPWSGSPRIQRIELQERGVGRVLVVIALDNRATRSEIVTLQRRVGPETLRAAAAFLADRLGGRTLEETRRDLEQLLSGGGSEAQDVAAQVARGSRSLLDADRILQLTFEGVAEALEQPEFAEPARLKALLELMSKAEEFERALEVFVREGKGEVSMAIGHENPLAALHPFSLVATRYQLGGLYGYLGILGPVRMRYSRSLALIRAIASHLDRLA
jgi:heat-inducible transcriptional repressor